MMDFLLRLFGEDPIVYVTTSDKLGGLLGAALFFATEYLQYILPILGVIIFILFLRKKIKSALRIIIYIVVIAIILWWVGRELPWIINQIIGGIAIRGIYGEI